MSLAANPTLHTAPSEQGRRPFRALLGTYLRPQWRSTLLLCLLMFAGITLQLVNPWVLGSFIDNAIGGAGTELLTQLALLYLGLALVAQLAQVAETYVAQNVGLTATNRLRADLLLHSLHLDPAFHNAHTPGELIERVDGDVATLGNFFSRFVVNLLGNGLLLVGVLVAAVRHRLAGGPGRDHVHRCWRVFADERAAAASPCPTGRRRARPAPSCSASWRSGWPGTEDMRANGADRYAMRRLHERSRPVLRKQQRKAGVVGSADRQHHPRLPDRWARRSPWAWAATSSRRARSPWAPST